MKKVRHIIIASLLTLSIPLAQAQEVHHTLYDMVPVWLNPASTGGFSGTIRLSGIYRNQWFGLLSDGASYSTFGIAADVPVVRGLRPYDWIGVGIMFSSDRAGTFNLGRSTFLGSAAYHFAMDNQRKNILALGVQYGGTNFKLEQPLPDEVVGTFDLTNALNFNNNEATSNANVLNVGLNFRSQLNENADMQLGGTLYNLLEQNYSLISAGGGGGGGNVIDERKYPSRFGVHAHFNYQLNEKFSLHPSLFYQSLRANNEMQIQTMIGYTLKPANAENPIRLKAGLGYRMADAVELMLGAEIDDFAFGLAYDLTTSELTDAQNTPGTIELAANYIIKVHKEPEVPPALFCPRL